MTHSVNGINPRLVDQHMRVVLPKNIADALRIKRGDHVAFIVEEDSIKIRKVVLNLD